MFPAISSGLSSLPPPPRSGKFGFSIHQRGKRLVSVTTAEAVLRRNREFILYLRGFRADDAASEVIGAPKTWQGTILTLLATPLTEEEQLARALKAFLPVVAV